MYGADTGRSTCLCEKPTPRPYPNEGVKMLRLTYGAGTRPLQAPSQPSTGDRHTGRGIPSWILFTRIDLFLQTSLLIRLVNTKNVTFGIQVITLPCHTRQSHFWQGNLPARHEDFLLSLVVIFHFHGQDC